MSIGKKVVARFDAWLNILTNMGVKNKDKRMGTSAYWAPMVETDCDALYAGSDVARKICEDLPSESFREGYEVKADALTDDVNKLLLDETDRLKFNEKVLEAAVWARIYGGSAIIPITDNVLELAKPFNPNNIRRVRNLLVVSRFELIQAEIDNDIRSPNFGRPLTYRICPRGVNANNRIIHYSHVIRFDGAPLPRLLFQQNNYWHDSILNACQQPIADYESVMGSLTSALQDFSVGVFKIKGLHEQIAQGDDESVVNRMQIVSLTRSIARAIVVDADTEDFTYQDRTMSGVNEGVDKVSGRLVVASNMPHTRILGESPDGSNATGNSTTSQWYDTVASYQKNYLTERLIKLYDILFLQKEGPTKGVIPVGYEFEFAPLWQLPLPEEIAAREKQANIDEKYIQNGVTTPEQVTQSRFGSGKYSYETDAE